MTMVVVGLAGARLFAENEGFEVLVLHRVAGDVAFLPLVVDSVGDAAAVVVVAVVEHSMPHLTSFSDVGG